MWWVIKDEETAEADSGKLEALRKSRRCMETLGTTWYLKASKTRKWYMFNAIL